KGEFMIVDAAKELMAHKQYLDHSGRLALQTTQTNFDTWYGNRWKMTDRYGGKIDSTRLICPYNVDKQGEQWPICIKPIEGYGPIRYPFMTWADINEYVGTYYSTFAGKNGADAVRYVLGQITGLIRDDKVFPNAVIGNLDKLEAWRNRPI
ncbi:MAG: hypothetical protein P4L50_19065, partial [Anaerolineaceae bacterium]|nr:hypothetical protein [Anaerolineaceae bacterium]